MARLAVVRVPRAEAELAADALWARGVQAIEERVAGGEVIELVVDAAAVEDLASLGWPVSFVDVGDDWWDGWRAWAKPVRVGRLVVQPAWLEAGERGPDDVVVLIDPGRAFGSGAHPSTRLALSALERVVGPDVSVLDVGSGSGVLAIAAARLGAPDVVAVDIDPEARAATVANALANEVVIEVVEEGLAAVRRHFDVVVANLLAPTLVELAGELRGRVAPGGRLVLAGLLREQAERVFDALQPVAVEVEEELEGWVGATLRVEVSG